MTIYETLQKDHRKVIGLIDELITAKEDDSKKREKLVSQIRDELVPHARAEEAVLYNCIRDLDTAKDVVGHSYREHMEAETILRTLQVSDAVKMNWVNGATKLKEALEHHIQEEEGKIFTAARALFSEEEAIAMAEVFEKMKPVIKEQSFIGHSFDMMVNMMPERLRDVFRKLTPDLAKTEKEAEAQVEETKAAS